MKFTRYGDAESFAADTLDVLYENEEQNTLPIGFANSGAGYRPKWLLASVRGDSGVRLVAACTPPFNIILYETGNRPDSAALKLLSDELKSMGFSPSGVLAEQGLARRFAEVFAGDGGYRPHMTDIVMRLDAVSDVTTAPGFLRPLREGDLFFAPYWASAFGNECRVETHDIQTNAERLAARVGKDSYYIWEDGHPVAQAVHSKSTANGACISLVYTPPHYRGKGYATSAVAALSKILLERGFKFCSLYADAQNPISCGIYRKIGYRDVCVCEDIKFIERGDV